MQHWGSALARQAQQTVQKNPGIGRTTGDEKVYGQNIHGAVAASGMAPEKSAGDGAGADGDDDFGREHGGVSFLQWAMGY